MSQNNNIWVRFLQETAFATLSGGGRRDGVCLNHFHKAAPQLWDHPITLPLQTWKEETKCHILMISRLSQRQSCTLWPGPCHSAGWEPQGRRQGQDTKEAKAWGPEAHEVLWAMLSPLSDLTQALPSPHPCRMGLWRALFCSWLSLTQKSSHHPCDPPKETVALHLIWGTLCNIITWV